MKVRGLVPLFLLCLCMTATDAALAQQPVSPQKKDTQSKTMDPLAQAEADAAAEAGRADGSDAIADHAQTDYNREYWLYQRDVLNHSRKVYAWQHTSSIIIFFVVIFLVLVGVLFSWLQFRAAAYKGESEELDASMQGIKITSSTLGVIILVLSMCFFYLYLRYVYPVNVNDTSAPVIETKKGAGH